MRYDTMFGYDTLDGLIDWNGPRLEQLEKISAWYIWTSISPIPPLFWLFCPVHRLAVCFCYCFGIAIRLVACHRFTKVDGNGSVRCGPSLAAASQYLLHAGDMCRVPGANAVCARIWFGL